MKSRVIVGIMLTLLFTGMLTLAFNIQPVKASATIYIRADGSIEGTTDIMTVDNVTYTFTDNIFNQSIIVERDNIVVDGAGYTLQGTGAWNSKGINLTGRSNVTIKNMKFESFGIGIWLEDSSNNIVSGNNITNNDTGIYLYLSSNNSICGNNITNKDTGILCWTSSNNIISENNIADNNNGIHLMVISDYNNISGNNIRNNGFSGVSMWEWSDHNRIWENNIANSEYGIYFDEAASPSFIYHNNFINNIYQTPMWYIGFNTWDDGYPSGGNYWSDHNPPDLYSGPYQNETDRDKIGDIPYIIDGNNIDRYPLIYPYGYVPTIDLDGNGLIEIIDIVIVALAFGSRPGDPHWNPYADINQDGIVDIVDLVMVAIHFGETWYKHSLFFMQH